MNTMCNDNDGGSDDDNLPADFLDHLRARLDRVFDHVQLDGEPHARAVVEELRTLVTEAEARGLRDMSETARDALAEAWRWRRGDDPMDARIRVARLARRLWLDTKPN